MTHEETAQVKAAWRKFRDGVHLSDSDLELMITSAEAGIEFLQTWDKSDAALLVARQDLICIQGLKRRRELRC